jgi:hypothetical protein
MHYNAGGHKWNPYSNILTGNTVPVIFFNLGPNDGWELDWSK